MTRDEIIKALAEISDYLYAAINSLRGTKIGENYYRWQRAIVLAGWILSGGVDNGRFDL